MAQLDDDTDDVVWMTIPMSPRTAERLLNLSNDCHAAPDKVAASLLHDVLADDEAAHHDQHAPVGVHLH